MIPGEVTPLIVSFLLSIVVSRSIRIIPSTKNSEIVSLDKLLVPSGISEVTSAVQLSLFSMLIIRLTCILVAGTEPAGYFLVSVAVSVGIIS